MPPEKLLSRALGLSAADEALLSVAWDGQRTMAPGEAHALQEAFVRFHRFMFRQKLLPLSLLGLERGRGSGVPVATSSQNGGPRKAGDWDWSLMDEEVVSRRGFVEFLQQNGHLAAQERPSANSSGGVHCLGWDDFTYVNLPQLRCDPLRSMVFRYSTKASVRPPVVSADLNAHSIDQLRRVRGRFDLILCNQVFEHVANPFNAARLLREMLKPRGLIFWTAPFIEIYHRAPEDHFRYTCPGAVQLFRNSGLSPIRIQKIGDTEAATGYLLGFGTRDLRAGSAAGAVNFVNSRVDSEKISMHPWDSAYISCALVVQR